MQFTNHISKDEFESLGPAVFFTNPSPLFSDQDIDFEEVEQEHKAFISQLFHLLQTLFGREEAEAGMITQFSTICNLPALEP